MSYIFLYIGMIIGYIIHGFRKVFRLKTKRHEGLGFRDKLHKFVYKVRVNCRKLLSNIICNFILFCSKIRSLLCLVKKKILEVNSFIKAKLRRTASQLLSKKNMYICAKTASVYSQGRKIQILGFESVLKFCKKGGGSYRIIEDRSLRTVCKPQFFEGSNEKIEVFESPEIYVAELNNICVYGGSSILYNDSFCLYDPVAEDVENRLDIKFSNVIGIVQNKIIVEKSNISRKVDKAISLLGFASYNYYHLTVEILSRLKYIDSIEEYKGVPVLIDNIVLQIPQYTQLLDSCNRYDHPVISIAEHEEVNVENLIFISYNTWMPINVKKREMIHTSDFLIAKSGLDNLRDCIDVDDELPFRKIFISRKNQKSARLENEQVIAKMFQKYGFEIVYTEELSFKEQVELFHQAEWIAGTSGAALTNIVYCQPKTKLVCIIPEEYNFYMYSTIAHMIGMIPVFLNAEVVVKTSYTASDMFSVDIKYCERFLKQYFE